MSGNMLDTGEMMEHFGRIKVEGDQVVGPPGWESANLTRIVWMGRSIRVHRLIVPALQEAERRFIATGNPWRPATVGTFAPRPMRTNPAVLSKHSWAAALDVDADHNPMIRAVVGDPKRPTAPTFPMEFVEAMEGVGFVWGGRWASVYDGMHFEAGRKVITSAAP